MTYHKHTSKNPQAVACDFSTFFTQLAENNASFTVALSGGSTPKILFDLLAAEFSEAIDWNNIHFYWGDERCVPPKHEESNYKMTEEHLFSKVSVPVGNIHRVLGENDPVDEAGRYGKLIRENLPSANSLPQFDLIILGMGSDGHTASIFPHEMSLLHSNKVCEVATHPDSGQKRVTLTGPVINNARNIAFLVTGESKKPKTTEIFGHKANYKTYPAAHIRPTRGDLHWFLDESATPG
ncbi:MAG: 6-phosphogluconolactonase [Cyclobacteriaceae bacterium]|nr:6-phosphogluconolactonase [Cyclobacteriaceae bacterium HetDA_MAG_MS6]